MVIATAPEKSVGGAVSKREMAKKQSLGSFAQVKKPAQNLKGPLNGGASVQLSAQL